MCVAVYVNPEVTREINDVTQGKFRTSQRSSYQRVGQKLSISKQHTQQLIYCQLKHAERKQKPILQDVSSSQVSSNFSVVMEVDKRSEDGVLASVSRFS